MYMYLNSQCIDAMNNSNFNDGKLKNKMSRSIFMENHRNIALEICLGNKHSKWYKYTMIFIQNTCIEIDTPA